MILKLSFFSCSLFDSILQAETLLLEMESSQYQNLKSRVMSMTMNNNNQHSFEPEKASLCLGIPSCETQRFQEDSAPLIFGLGDGSSVASESMGEINSLAFDQSNFFCSTPKKESDNFENSSSSSSEDIPVGEPSTFDASFYSNIFDPNVCHILPKNHSSIIGHNSTSLLVNNTLDGFGHNSSHTPTSLNLFGFSNNGSKKKKSGVDLFTSNTTMRNVGQGNDVGDLSLLNNGDKFRGGCTSLNSSMLFQHQPQTLASSILSRSSANMFGEQPSQLILPSYTSAIQNMVDNEAIIQQFGNIAFTQTGKNLTQDGKIVFVLLSINY